jgi:hypothetical protein
MAMAVTVGSNWVSTVKLIVSCSWRAERDFQFDLHYDSLDESVGMAPSSL